jgi:hypothetical protein
MIGAERPKARAALEQRTEIRSAELPAKGVGLGAIGVGSGAPADEGADGKELAFAERVSAPTRPCFTM